MEGEIGGLDKLEEIYWKQRTEKKWVLMGDSNTHFYHQFANGRRRNNTISFLDSDQGEIRGQKDITAHIVSYYKSLFRTSDPCHMALGPDFWPANLKLTNDIRDHLVREFDTQEVKGVIMEMNSNTALGPNGFGVSFFKTFWEIIKDDILALFRDFHAEQLDIKRMNFGVITLVPKVKEGNIIKQYRPIRLLNVDYKWITKTMTNRLTLVAKDVIDRNQIMFIKGINILEGVMILHEVLHELWKNKGYGLILKIDFEKAYNRVRWYFLEQVMLSRNFHPKWVKWVMDTVKGEKYVLMSMGREATILAPLEV